MSQLVLKGFLEMLLRDRKHKHVNIPEKDEDIDMLMRGTTFSALPQKT